MFLSMAIASRTAPGFDLVGGARCLDFANTAGAVRTSQPRDDLKNYSGLLTWSRQSGILNKSQALDLEKAAHRRPRERERAWRRALKLRSAIYEIFSALAARKAAPASGLEVLNEELLESATKTLIVQEKSRFEVQLVPEACGLLLPLHAVARDAAGLLTSRHLKEVRECGAPTCSWLFLDRTRNHSRRWCDMTMCGNRMKQVRHRRSRARP